MEVLNMQLRLREHFISNVSRKYRLLQLGCCKSHTHTLEGYFHVEQSDNVEHFMKNMNDYEYVVLGGILDQNIIQEIQNQDILCLIIVDISQSERVLKHPNFRLLWENTKTAFYVNYDYNG